MLRIGETKNEISLKSNLPESIKQILFATKLDCLPLFEVNLIPFEPSKQKKKGLVERRGNRRIQKIIEQIGYDLRIAGNVVASL